MHGIPNKGWEFGSYFWYICKYWHDLPEKVVFLHGHETSHHQSTSVKEAISTFRGESFHGLNGPRIGAYHYFFSESNHPWFGDKPSFESAWSHRGMDRFVYRPLQFVFQGGTQSIVSKDLIKSNPLSFYRGVLDCLMTSSDYALALFYEMCWHVIFGQPVVTPHLLDRELHSFCLASRSSILLHGRNMVWSSSLPATIEFETLESDKEWKELCLSLLWSTTNSAS